MTDTTERPATVPITAAHTRTLAITLTNAFGDDRDARLHWLSARLDHDVASMNALTEAEYEQVIPLARALPKHVHDPSPAPRRTAEQVNEGARVDDLHPTEPLPLAPVQTGEVVLDDGPPPVQEAVRRIIYDIGHVGVGKTNQNREQGYNFRGIDDFVQKLSPLLAKHGAVILPRVTRHKITDFQTTRRDGSMGALQQQAVLTVEWSVVGPAGDSLTAATVGQARDSADKASNKAMSAAFKYLLAQVFMVPNIGWDEQDFDSPEVSARAPRPARGSTPPPPATPTPDQRPVDPAVAQAEHAALLAKIAGYAEGEHIALEEFTARFRHDHGDLSMDAFESAPLDLLRGWVRRLDAWYDPEAVAARRAQDAQDSLPQQS
jgi:hypothetical protein